MARLARIVFPGAPHHVTQRGNRRPPIFFSDDHRKEYLSLLAEAAASGTRCLTWCAMHSHAHLFLMPQTTDGLRAMLGGLHRRYSRMINIREGAQYLVLGGFTSYSMDDANLMMAVRCVEWNPVAARLVTGARDWA